MLSTHLWSRLTAHTGRLPLKKLRRRSSASSLALVSKKQTEWINMLTVFVRLRALSHAYEYPMLLLLSRRCVSPASACRVRALDLISILLDYICLQTMIERTKNNDWQSLFRGHSWGREAALTDKWEHSSAYSPTNEP